MNTSNLKRNIMMRIYLIFAIRKLKSPLYLKLSCLVSSLIFTGVIVSLRDVVANAPHQPVELFYFGKAAFWNTQLVVKMALLVAAVAALFLVKDIPRYLGAIPKPRLV
ncbi:MAG: hypothetical protein WD896_01025 [Parcubacteria group bacterium]